MKNVKIKQFTKWLTRQIVRLLIMTIVANLLNAFFAPQIAKAADPNMMLFWDGDCAAPPSGWTVVSDGAGEAFYDATDGGLFARGNSSYGRYAGGAPTHTHSATVSAGSPSGTAKKGSAGSGYNDNAHTHTGQAGSVSSVSTSPAFKNLCVIQYSGIPSGGSAIPSGAIAIFDDTVAAANWSDYSATFGTNYLRGNSTAGGTGGSNTHQSTGQSITSITLNENLTDVNNKSGTTNPTGASTTGHYSSHTVANQTSDTPNTEPPYVTVILGKASADTSIPDGMLAMFDGSGFVTNGWGIQSDTGGPFNQTFLKVTGAYGTTGGATAHSHANLTPTASSAGGDASTGNGTGSIGAHTHTVTVSLANGTNTNLPPYTDVVIAKYSTASSGDARISYGSAIGGGPPNQRDRTWTHPSYGSETDGPGSVIYTSSWTVMKASPANTGVYVMAMLVNDGLGDNIQVYSYASGSWTSEFTAKTANFNYRPIDVAFENISGNVLVIYMTSTSTTTLYYQEGSWNGTDYDWSSGSASFSTTIGNLRFLRLTNRLASDQMIAVATGDNASNQVNAFVWSGSAMGNEGGAWGTLNSTSDNMDAAWESNSGEGLVTWGWGSSPYWRYATWNGATWTASNGTSDANLTAAVTLTALATNPDPSSDRMALSMRESTNTLWGLIWNGSSWSQMTELDTSTNTTTGRLIDTSFAGTTGNAIIVYGDSSGAAVDWARSAAGGAFQLKGDWTPTATIGNEAITAVVADASGSNIIMYNLVDANSDLFGFYYDDNNQGWNDPEGAALEVASSGGTTLESFMFAWESVYKVPTLTEVLFLILVSAAVFLGVKTGVIKFKRTSRIEPREIQKPPKKQLPIENNETHQTRGSLDYRSGFRASPSKSIDGITRRERN